MKLGTENRRNVAILCGLGLVLAYLLYSNVFSGESAAEPSVSPVGTTARSATAAADAAAAAEKTPRRPANRAKSGEFRPVFRPTRQEDRIDITTIDPTLRLDLLAKLQQVTPEAGGRNLFQFGAAPLPPQSAVKKLPPEPVVEVRQPAAPTPAIPSGPPPPPPIPLKYYGFSTVALNGRKTAFFLDGEEPLLGRVGDTIKKRYRVVSIGVNSVTLEDLELKRQQSVPLAEEANAPG